MCKKVFTKYQKSLAGFWTKKTRQRKVIALKVRQIWDTICNVKKGVTICMFFSIIQKVWLGRYCLFTFISHFSDYIFSIQPYCLIKIKVGCITLMNCV